MYNPWLDIQLGQNLIGRSIAEETFPRDCFAVKSCKLLEVYIGKFRVLLVAKFNSLKKQRPQ